MARHIPVLLKESLTGLNLKKSSVVVDATADGGSHAHEILHKLGARGKLILLDWDPEMVKRLEKLFAGEPRVKIFHLNFSFLEKVARTLTPPSAGRPDAIFFDLGLSSLQLVASGRGFSFGDEKLEMTYDPSVHPDAREFIAEASGEELEKVIREYGEEKQARRISVAIIEARKKKAIRSGRELAEIIAGKIPRRGRLHPATKTFQALRIYVNRELENLESGLKGGWKILKPGGRLAVISFHSLEDRIVKNFLKGKAQAGEAKLIAKKPLRPLREEILKNPRSRSAKLRILEKI